MFKVMGHEQINIQNNGLTQMKRKSLNIKDSVKAESLKN